MGTLCLGISHAPFDHHARAGRRRVHCISRKHDASEETATRDGFSHRIATGKARFLKWMAAREAIDKEVGIAATQWHMSTAIRGITWPSARLLVRAG